MIGILDLGMGNLRSLSNAIEHNGFDVQVTEPQSPFDDFTQEDVNQMRRAWVEHLVVRFRHTGITDEQQIRFSAMLGKFVIHPRQMQEGTHGAHREILVTQANWVRNRVTEDQPVVDVSPRNDWSMVRVWWPPSGQMGVADYPAHGFLLATRPKSRDELAQILIKHTSVKDPEVYKKMAYPGLHPNGTLNVAGKQQSNGLELSAAVRPAAAWNLWGNIAYTHAYYSDYTFAGGSFSGNAPPNVPRVVANAGVVYRVASDTPVELGASVRHVGDRYHSDANTVKLLAYTVGDAFASIDVRKTKFSLRVRNLTNERYAVWSDAFYPDQILLGAPRSYEVSAVMKF